MAVITIPPELIITAEAQAAAATEAARTALRAERDRLLAASDYTQLPDAPGDTAARALYRQALRVLPEVTTDPVNPVWPMAPGKSLAAI